MEEKDAVAALGALGFDTRLAVVRLLSAAGKEGLAAGEIARKLQVQQNTLSDHLGLLARSGLLSTERCGRSIIYRLDTGSLQALLDFLRIECLDVRSAN
ncbi:metalloregulator ArsR/SmtB family transcription factor [Sphingomonas sp. KRR8]|uniref:ArsR/SmtB family transcription factor n=1 Tax=Sphingomonas sp. KRR8 TaxID=2942996 RepID=UPI0020207072|nr:metalloregulator ArsR/SmtB family transcription factor [Sphingomonas sp. KRR8]URD61090.1 metalloregulator ArsR/SmtB family transcription factor [Sphingomonas sp. KRR8]